MVFFELVRQIQMKTNQHKSALPLKIVDSSTLPLNLTRCNWATFRKSKGGVKLHHRFVFGDQDTVYPDKAVITNAVEHDRNQLEILVDDKDAMCLIVDLSTMNDLIGTLMKEFFCLKT